MDRSTAEISAIATALAELTARVSALADLAASDSRSEIASELFAVERALTNANRKMMKLGNPRR